MKSLMILFVLIITFSIIFVSCESNEDHRSNDPTNLINYTHDDILKNLLGKWMLVSNYGGFKPNRYTEKDGIYMIYNSDMTYESFKKDSIVIKDTFNILWDKPSYGNDSGWVIIQYGFPIHVVKDSSTWKDPNYPEYETVNYLKSEITLINNSKLILQWIFTDEYIKIENNK